MAAVARLANPTSISASNAACKYNDVVTLACVFIFVASRDVDLHLSPYPECLVAEVGALSDWTSNLQVVVGATRVMCPPDAHSHRVEYEPIRSTPMGGRLLLFV